MSAEVEARWSARLAAQAQLLRDALAAYRGRCFRCAFGEAHALYAVAEDGGASGCPKALRGARLAAVLKQHGWPPVVAFAGRRHRIEVRCEACRPRGRGRPGAKRAAPPATT